MGRKQSLETRKKISESAKKVGVGKWMLGRKKNWNYTKISL